MEKIQGVVNSASLTKDCVRSGRVWWHYGESLVTLARDVSSKYTGKRIDCHGSWASVTGGYINGANKTSLLCVLQIPGRGKGKVLCGELLWPALSCPGPINSYLLFSTTLISF